MNEEPTNTKRSVPQSVFDSKEALQIAKLAHKQAVDQLAKIPTDKLDVGNPNHPIHDGIFGYDRKEFLQKQYR